MLWVMSLLLPNTELFLSCDFYLNLSQKVVSQFIYTKMFLLAISLFLPLSLEWLPTLIFLGFPGGSDSKRIHLPCGRSGIDPWVGKIPWRRKWQPTPVCLPGESHGQRSLVGYSPWGGKESDMTDHEHTHSSNQPYPNTK